jgi:hypothetical protein
MGSFKWNPLFKPTVADAVSEGITAYLLITSGAVREQLSKGGTGRLYRRTKNAAPRGAVGRAMAAWDSLRKKLGGKAKRPNARTAGWHRASAKNSPPAVDTGLLRRSWTVGSGGRDQAGNGKPTVRHYRQAARIGVTFGSPVKYARIEAGWGRVAPRPYIKPTITAIRDLFPTTMQRALKRRMGGGA